MSDKMRDDFEAAAKSRWPGFHGDRYLLLRINLPGSETDGQYENPIVHHAWWAWQASRESLVIELPDYLNTDKLGFPAYDADAVDAAIEAVGLKVKP